MKGIERQRAKDLQKLVLSGKKITLVDNSGESTSNYKGTLKFASDQNGTRYVFVDEQTGHQRPVYKRDNLSFDYRSNGVIVELDSSARRDKRRNTWA